MAQVKDFDRNLYEDITNLTEVFYITTLVQQPGLAKGPSFFCYWGNFSIFFKVSVCIMYYYMYCFLYICVLVRQTLQ